MKTILCTLVVLGSMIGSFAEAQTTPQSKAEILNCLSAPVGSANFIWSIQFAQNLSQKLDPRASFDQLKQNLANSNQVRDAVRDAVKKSLGLTVQNFSPMMILKPGFNASSEILNMLSRLKSNLKTTLSTIRVEEEANFQIMIAPKLSEELLARRAGGSGSREIPLMTSYPADRLVVFQNMSESDSAFKTAEDLMVTDIYAGLAQYFHQSYECKLAQPFFASAQITVKVLPQVQDSEISTQVVLGMPSGVEIPFVQANDQVQFQKIMFPRVNPEKLAITNGGLTDASQYPVALISITQKIESTAEVPVLIEFGPLGTYQNKKWTRVPKADYAEFAPKLKGLAVGNAIKRNIAIDFNIYNLSLNLAKQEVTDLDIFLSVGTRRLQNFTVGRINRTDVDSQFQSEINKTIQQQINTQKENFQRISNLNLTPDEQKAVTEAAAKLGDQKGVPPDFTKQLFQALFGAVGAGR